MHANVDTRLRPYLGTVWYHKGRKFSSHHRVATRLIKELMEHQNPYLGDNTMPAVIGLVATVCTNRVYNTSAEQEHEKTLHVQGLRRMVAARGGDVAGIVFSCRLLATILTILPTTKTSAVCGTEQTYTRIDLRESGNAFPRCIPSNRA
jgi:hypothetical protein